ncbi:MAG: VOC family protein [Candidatus Lokiarchaeota archaeon]|nr:VOC family protein [Candidatus Lokiarchaeota archaeon]
MKNIEVSRQFYANTLGQEITANFGRNVVFQGGLSIWEEKYALSTIYSLSKANIKVGRNNSEIYFETRDIERAYKKFKKDGIEIIHEIMEHPWGQKGFRLFDPDKHVIEISEPMDEVVLRYHNIGYDMKEISEKTMMPINMVKKIIETLK